VNATQLLEKLDAVLAVYPEAVYTPKDGLIFIFSDGVTKQISAADIYIDVIRGQLWHLDGVSL